MRREPVQIQIAYFGAPLQAVLSVQEEASQTTDSDKFFVQFNSSSNDGRFNMQHPNVEVSMGSDHPWVMLLTARKEQPAASLMRSLSISLYPCLSLAASCNPFISRPRFTLPLCPCHVQVNDTKGDVLAYPKTVLELPFSDQDDTFFYADDYQYNCSGDYPDSGSGKVSMLWLRRTADCIQRS